MKLIYFYLNDISVALGNNKLSNNRLNKQRFIPHLQKVKALCYGDTPGLWRSLMILSYSQGPTLLCLANLSYYLLLNADANPSIMSTFRDRRREIGGGNRFFSLSHFY